eukprot:1157777-Pelagomonas_calceolata.AAC.7
MDSTASLKITELDARVAIGASTAQHDSATAPPALRVSLPPRPSPRLLLLLLLPLPLPVLPWSAVVPFALGQRAPSSHTHAGCRPHNLRRWGATALLPHFTCSNALLCTAAAADAALAAAAAEVPHGPKPPCKAPPGPTERSRLASPSFWHNNITCGVCNDVTTLPVDYLHLNHRRSGIYKKEGHGSRGEHSAMQESRGNACDTQSGSYKRRRRESHSIVDPTHDLFKEPHMRITIPHLSHLIIPPVPYLSVLTAFNEPHLRNVVSHPQQALGAWQQS